MTWVDGQPATVAGGSANASAVTFEVRGVKAAPRYVRYTANKAYPQCAVYNHEGFPAMPFDTEVEAATVATATTAGGKL